MPRNGQVAVLKYSPIWKKMRKRLKHYLSLKLKCIPKKEPGKGKLWLYQLEWKPYFPQSSHRKGQFIVSDSYFNTWDSYLDIYSNIRRKTEIIELIVFVKRLTQKPSNCLLKTSAREVMVLVIPLMYLMHYFKYTLRRALVQSLDSH